MKTDEQAIRDLIATWISASKAGDTAKVLSLMAEDVVFLLAGQPTMRGKAAFASAQSALQPYRVDAHSEIKEIEVLGEWAYCWTHLTVMITPRNGDAAVKRTGDTLSILRKEGGAWVIVRDANMLTVVRE
jgi:uncharacterized protein (TIGR02246 family)